MRRYFNTEGSCNPGKHYMVCLDERMDRIKRLYVDRGKYFVINRGRQYGKTTTLQALEDFLKQDYVVLPMDFQEIGTADFRDEAAFSKVFAKICIRIFQNTEIAGREDLTEPLVSLISEPETVTLNSLFAQLSILCGKAPKPIVLIIDEVDSASNNQVFVDFLAMLRKYYLEREKQPTFYSVVLAGVYDIKNLKLKIRPEAEHKYNSPWNTREGNEENGSLLTFDDCPRDQKERAPFDIAAEFNIEMSFSARQIAGMLEEYEADNCTGMDVPAIAEEIYRYTSGYPYLVSAICKFLDEELWCNEGFEELSDVWTRAGIIEAVKDLLGEPLPLFESMMRQLSEYPDMKQMLNAILFQGRRVTYNPDNPTIQLASMFGYIVNRENSIQVANRVFEMRLYNFFLSEEELTDVFYDEAQGNRNQFIKNGKLNMDLVLEKFVAHYTDIYSGNDEKFVEEYGRKFFLLYLKPIINGVGNYYIEAQTRDARRTDIVVDYRGQQFVVEFKIWHGNEYNERGEQQLAEYLDYFHQTKGYMLSFNFNKNKQTGMKTVELGSRTIVEAVV